MTAPTIVYNPDIPKDQRSSFGADQENFLNNFMTLYNAFAFNHVPLDASSGAGNHTVIDLLEQPTDSQFQTDLGEISIYCKKTDDQTNEIYLRYQGNQEEFALTAYQIYGLNQTDYPNQYFTFLPGNIIVYFGTISVTYSTKFPNGVPMELFPAIAKNIITLNFCIAGSTAGYPPTVSIQQPADDGIVSVILLYPARTEASARLNYVIMANL